QVIDYGADMWGMTPDVFESSVAMRYFKGPHCSTPELRASSSLAGAARVVWPDISDDELSRLCPFGRRNERGRVPWTHTPLARKGEPWKPCRERLYACCGCLRTSSASGCGIGCR